MATASAACRVRADGQRAAGASRAACGATLRPARAGRIGVRHGRQVGYGAPTGRPLSDLVALPGVRHAARKPLVYSTGAPRQSHSMYLRPVRPHPLSGDRQFRLDPPGETAIKIRTLLSLTDHERAAPAVDARYRHLQATARLPARGWGNRTLRRRRTRIAGAEQASDQVIAMGELTAFRATPRSPREAAHSLNRIEEKWSNKSCRSTCMIPASSPARP
jgi:hypothetical protein